MAKGALGIVQALDITEASGIVASRQNAGVLWTHNDSGFPGSVFALSTNGALLARHTILLPIPPDRDFEDIAIGPGPLAEFQYIYLGDIGDKKCQRGSKNVQTPEPRL